jgi:beta-glucosidase
VKNAGKIAGREVVQVYVESPHQRERYRLVGFLPVELGKNKSKKITIPLAADTYQRRDWKGDFYTLEGEHTLHIGVSQPDNRSVELTGVAVLSAKVEV